MRKISKQKKWVIGIIIAIIGGLMPLLIWFLSSTQEDTNVNNSGNIAGGDINIYNSDTSNQNRTNDSIIPRSKIRELLFFGIVSDENGNPICCAKIMLNGNVFKSDTLGNFNIKIKTNKKSNFREKMIVIKKGYFEFEKIIYYNASQSLNVELKMKK